jgi:cell division septum initiation protein DivIVA
MAHPLIEEINRCYSLQHVQNQAFRRWQRLLRDDVQPLLDERETFLVENHRLHEEILMLRKAIAAYEQAQPAKRGPGRPRKEEAATV